MNWKKAIAVALVVGVASGIVFGVLWGVMDIDVGSESAENIFISLIAGAVSGALAVTFINKKK